MSSISQLRLHNKYHRLGGLNIRNVFSHNPGGWKFETKVIAGVVPSEATLRGYRRSSSPVSSQDLPSVWVCVLISSSYKDNSHIGLGPILTISF